METLQPVNIFLPSQPAVRRTVTAAGAAMMVRKTSEVENFESKSPRSKLLNENVWDRNFWMKKSYVEMFEFVIPLTNTIFWSPTFTDFYPKKMRL